MTETSAPVRDGFLHEAHLYRSDDEVLSVVVPFLRDGHEHGEAAVVDVDDRKADLIRSELGHQAEGVEFVGGRWYTTPASAIREYVRCFESLVADDEGRTIRSVGELPPTTMNGSWSAWRRYEAVVNVAFAELPVWGICLFDMTVISPDMLADVLCTHPLVTAPPGPSTMSTLYTDPSAWLTQLPPPSPAEVERTAPLVEVVDAAPHDARAAVAPLAEGLSASDRDGLLGGVSEVVSNAIRHGEPPVTLRAWASPGHVVVTVDDCGSGIDDPFAGMVAPHREMGAGGLGLWVTHQLCRDVALMNTPEGFRVRLVAGSGGRGPVGGGGAA